MTKNKRRRATRCRQETDLGRVSVRFDQPDISSDGGLLLLRRVDDELGLTRRLAKRFKDTRQPGKVLYTHLSMIRQRVFGICMGYEDCNDHDSLRRDPMFELAICDKLAPQPTLSAFENRATHADLLRLSRELVEFFVDGRKSCPPKLIVIDMDATDDPAHGQQELEFFHGYYQTHCFLPLLVFCSCDDGDEELVAAILRPGNSHAGKGSVEVLTKLVTRLRKAFPLAQVSFRGDAGFALPEMYMACEDLGISYLISLPRNARLEKLGNSLMAQARAERGQTGQTARVFGECAYAAQSWNKERRVVIKAEAMEKGDNPRFVVTNLAGEPEALYARYCKRGDCENRIKELKLDLSSGRTSCHKFLANFLRLLLHAIAFVLMTAVRSSLTSSELARSTMGQIRVRILKVAAIVVKTTRLSRVLLPASFPLRHIWDKLLPSEWLAT